jgi:hypothetical protein
MASRDNGLEDEEEAVEEDFGQTVVLTKRIKGVLRG